MISKKDVVAKAASSVGVTQKDCLAIVDAFIDAVIEAVATKDDVNLGDLGKIKIVDTKPTAERKMTSGLTGKEVVIAAKPAGQKATFKLSSKVKDAVSGK